MLGRKIFLIPFYVLLAGLRIKLHIHKNMKTPGTQAVVADRPSRAKEKRVLVWDFKGEEDSSQGDGKSKCLVNKCLPCQAEKSF